ncbi:cytochrome P450 [Archangium primigenium]|uniref:cytochrome P450 n=1 Tax=[Archangium] primigenium TaxID=2792470 RepID=UPI0019581904|nr:cytochrome P450 [Archangium primigenium]MBM7117539.1 cytochrome P450 [Archangium primigenium]
MSNAVSASKTIPRIRELPLIGSLKDFSQNRLGLFMRVARECPEIGIFHVGPMRVALVTSSKLAQTVLRTQAADFHGGSLLNAIVPLMGPNNLFVLKTEEHFKQRKLMAPAFQHRRLAEFGPIMVDYASQLVDTWVDGEVIDITKQMPLLTMRVVVKTLFDVDFAHEAHEFDEAMQESVDYLEYLTSSLIPVPLSWPTARNRRVRRALTTIRERQTALIEERRRGKLGNDLLSSLISYRDEEGNGLSDEQLRDHASTIFTAGHETVAIALGWTWYLLQQHPEVYRRLQEEVDTVLQGRMPTVQDLSQLTYAMQVVKEAMRLYPPGYFLGRAALHDTSIDGYPLRKDDIVAISPYTIHRDETVFPDPEKFDPDRFTPEQEKGRSRYAYLPFSDGPHICIGNFFALMEAQIATVIMAQRVRFEPMPNQKVVAEPGVSLRMSSFFVRVHRRMPAREAEPATPIGATG